MFVAMSWSRKSSVTCLLTFVFCWELPAADVTKSLGFRPLLDESIVRVDSELPAPDDGPVMLAEGRRAVVLFGASASGICDDGELCE